MKHNISNLQYCYGCGVCVAVCPLHLISFELNRDGFYEPVIKENDKCIECGLCIKTCSKYSATNIKCKFNPCGYATWSRDDNIRRIASSGGTGFEIARTLISKGYIFLGVRYNCDEGRAEHYHANNIDELYASIGSKYIQSYSSISFSMIKKGNKYVIVGTPCQIASLRNFINLKHMQEDVILVDFFCHGIPSFSVWKKYCSEAEKKIGNIVNVSWRNKKEGWHRSWIMTICGDGNNCIIDAQNKQSGNHNSNTIYSPRMSGDLFYKFFLGNMCLNKSCYHDCKFKMLNSSADIRLGDLWGRKYKNNELGITGAIAFTENGQNVLMESNIEKVKEPLEVVTEEQMHTSLKQPYYYPLIMKLLRSPLHLKTIYRIIQLFRIGVILKYKMRLL